MTIEFVTKYIETKEKENNEFIRYTFYELRVKNNLSKEDAEEFLDVNKDYFENKGYRVYTTGDKYIYKNMNMTVQDNELFIAIKD